MNWSSILDLLRISLHAMVPITLTAVGEIIGETAGLFNIGLEGILLIGAFVGTLGAKAGGPIVGLLAGVGVGMAISFVFAVISAYWKGTQMIAGIGINLFALGFVAFGLIKLGAPGFHAVPQEGQLAKLSTPMGALSPLIFVALVTPFLAHLFLNRTRAGLILKAVGENPEAADVAGIDVNLTRLLATTFGGAVAGLAGAFLSVAWIGSVTKEMSAGTGFIALATVVFSGLNPLLALLGGFIFGFFQSLATWIKTLPTKTIPWQFVDMLPYIVTLLVVSGVVGRVRFPKALGVPYKRE